MASSSPTRRARPSSASRAAEERPLGGGEALGKEQQVAALVHGTRPVNTLQDVPRFSERRQHERVDLIGECAGNDRDRDGVGPRDASARQAAAVVGAVHLDPRRIRGIEGEIRMARDVAERVVVEDAVHAEQVVVLVSEERGLVVPEPQRLQPSVHPDAYDDLADEDRIGRRGIRVGVLDPTERLAHGHRRDQAGRRDDRDGGIVVGISRPGDQA